MKNIISAKDKWQKLFAEASWHHQSGNIKQALRCYQKILQNNPQHSDALHLSGVALASLGKPMEGIANITRAIGVHPTHFPYYINRGLLYKNIGKAQSAIADFNQALYLGHTSVRLYNDLSDCFLATKAYTKAIAMLKKALLLEQNDTTTLKSLSCAYWQAEDYRNAEDIARKVLLLEQDSASSIANLALILASQEKFDEAIAFYHRAITVKPDFMSSYISLCSTYKLVYRFKEAEAICKQALAIWPNEKELYKHLGTTYSLQNQKDLAAECFRNALKIGPSPEIEYCLALSCLALGDFGKGWQHHEARLDTQDYKNKLRYKKPRWQGNLLPEKKLLVYAEQGLGDTILFFRYLKLFPIQNNICFFCNKALVPILKPHFENTFDEKEYNQDCDQQVSIMSLPHYFNIDSLDKIPGREGYILAPKNHKLNGFLKDASLKVGITWAGNKHNRIDQERSIPLAKFKNLLEVEGIKFYSLQYGEKVEDIAEQKLESKLQDTSPLVENLADTAAIIAQMDLIITCDTVTAHLSAAMAKPTWVLVSFSPAWMWFLQKKSSIFYNSARIFRQNKYGDWPAVLRQVKKELLAWQQKNNKTLKNSTIFDDFACS